MNQWLRFNRWEAKTNRTLYSWFFPLLRKWQAIARNSDWFVALFAPVVIGRSIYLVYRFCTAAILHGSTLKITCIRKNICSHGKKNLLFLPCNMAAVQNLYWFFDSEWVSATIEPSIGTLPISIRCSPIFETSPERDFSLEYFTEMLFSYIFGPSVVKYDILSNDRRSKLQVVIHCLFFQ